MLQVLHVYAVLLGACGCSFRHTFDRIHKCAEGVDDTVRMADCRTSDPFVLELDCVRQAFCLGVPHKVVVGSVMVTRREQIVTFLGLEIPSFSIIWFYMHLARAAHWGQRHPVIIEVAIEMRVG